MWGISPLFNFVWGFVLEVDLISRHIILFLILKKKFFLIFQKIKGLASAIKKIFFWPRKSFYLWWVGGFVLNVFTNFSFFLYIENTDNVGIFEYNIAIELKKILLIHFMFISLYKLNYGTSDNSEIKTVLRG